MTKEQAILNFLDELEGKSLHGFLLSHRGQTVAEGYWAPYTPEKPQRLFSVSKSVVSLAIGILLGDGKLRLEDPIVQFFPDYAADASELLKKVTIRSMLTMSTCYAATTYKIYADKNWAKTFFYAQPTKVPDTLFHYDTSASQVLCALVERLTGEDMLSFMEHRLFSKIHMDGLKQWLKDESGTSQGGTGLIMTLQDFSKLAQFCMSDGLGIVPESYLKAATSFQIANDEGQTPEERCGYGYQFWMMRRGFAMYGLGGQMALCLPDEDLCLCTLADFTLQGTGIQPLYDAFFRHLSDIGELPESAEDKKKLHERISHLSLAAPQGTVQAKTRTVRMNDDTLPFSAISVNDHEVIFTLRSGEFHLPYTPGVWTEGVFPDSKEGCLVSGGWTSENRFALDIELWDTFTCAQKVRIAFAHGMATVSLVGTLREFVDGWNGVGIGVEE